MSKALELAKFGRESAPAGLVVGDNDAQTLSQKTFSDMPVFSAGTVNTVPYLNASKVLSSSATLAFDGTNLGVGVASPGFRLDVGGGDGTNIAIRSTGTADAVLRGYVNGAESGTVRFINGGGIKFETAGGFKAQLNSSGYLSLGTTSATEVLTVHNSNYESFGIYRNLDYNSVGAMGVRMYFGGYVGSTPTRSAAIDGTLMTTTTGRMSFSNLIGGVLTESLRIETNGSVRIGGNFAAQASTAEKLTVDGGSSQAATLANTSDSYGTLYLKNKSNTAATIQPYLYFTDADGGNRSGFGVKITDASLHQYAQGGINWYTGSAGFSGLQATLTATGLGIGTAPNSNGRLSVYETTVAKLFLTDSTLGTTYGGQVRGYGTTGAGGQLELGVVDANTYNRAIRVYNQATAVTISTNSGANGSTAERLRIDNTGRILAGSTSGRGGSTTQHIFRIPTGSSYFEIQQENTSGTTDVLFTDGSTGTYGIVGYDHSVDALRIYTNSGERMRITSQGYVGIATTDPQSLLTINSGGTDNLAGVTINQTTDFAATSRAGFSGLTNNNGGFYFGMGANGTGIPAGFGFFREATGWNTALAFYTNNQTSGSYSTRAMQEKMRLDSGGNLNILTTTDNGTNSQALPGSLQFTGKGWNTNLGTKYFGASISLAAGYGELNGGSTEPSLVFSLYGTGSNGYSGNDGPTSLTERMRINNYGKVTVTGNIVSTLGGPIYETIDCLNINPAGTGFDSIGNNSDGGGTYWQVVGNRVVDLYSTSGGHGGTWGYPVRIDTPGYYRLKLVARLSSTNGSIHGSTPAGNYKYSIPIGFVLNTFSVYGKWDVDALGSGTRVCAIGAPAYCAAGTYQMTYSTSGYDGIKQIYLYELVVERVG